MADYTITTIKLPQQFTRQHKVKI